MNLFLTNTSIVQYFYGLAGDEVRILLIAGVQDHVY